MCSVLLCKWVLDRAGQRLESWVLHLPRECLIQHTDFPGWAHRSGVKGWTCCRWSWALLPATYSHSAATADSGQATGHAGGTLFFGTLIASLTPGPSCLRMGEFRLSLSCLQVHWTGCNVQFGR